MILSPENFLRWLKRFIIAEFDSVTTPCCSLLPLKPDFTFPLTSPSLRRGWLLAVGGATGLARPCCVPVYKPKEHFVRSKIILHCFPSCGGGGWQTAREVLVVTDSYLVGSIMSHSANRFTEIESRSLSSGGICLCRLFFTPQWEKVNQNSVVKCHWYTFSHWLEL